MQNDKFKSLIDIGCGDGGITQGIIEAQGKTFIFFLSFNE